MSSTNGQDLPPEAQEESTEELQEDRSKERRAIGIKRRDLLILGSIWLAGCALVAVLIGIFYANTLTVPASAELPPVPTVSIPFRGDSAKTVYLLALQNAQNWQSDVDLVALSTRWTNSTAEKLGQAEIWDFRFYSDKSQRIYFTVVTPDKNVVGRAHINKLRNAPYVVEPSGWVVDSNEAISIWANNGGGAFLTAFPENSVELLLRQTPAGPAWDILGINADQSQILYLSIDASTGAILNQQ